MEWNAQLTSPEVEKAVQFYVDTVREYGEPGAATSGFGECATQFAQGRAAMWYDATSAVSTLEDPKSSTVVGKVGYALAPKVEKDELRLAVHLVAGHPEEQRQARRRLEVHLVDDRPELHQVGRRGTRLGAGAPRQPAVDVRDPGVQGGLGGVRAGDTRVDRRRRPAEAHRSAGALHRGAVPGHSGVPGSGHAGQPADQRGHRRTRSRSPTRWNSPRNTQKSSAGPIRRSHDNHCARLVGR